VYQTEQNKNIEQHPWNSLETIIADRRVKCRLSVVGKISDDSCTMGQWSG